MNYVIPMTDKKLSHHFSKADFFSVYNEQHENIAVFKNPILGIAGGAAKRLLINEFTKHQCSVVIVRKIGQRTLSRLLGAGFSVEQGNTRHSVEELLTAASLKTHPLTEVSQGVKNKPVCGQ